MRWFPDDQRCIWPRGCRCVTDSDQKPYYNHDDDWQSRANQGNPRWGGQSEKVYDRFIDWINHSAAAGSRVLDAGCGAGAFGVRLSQLGFDYVGVDESSVGIDLGKKSQDSMPHFALQVLDLAKIPCPSDWLGFFDMVTSVNVLHCLVEAKDRAHYLDFMSQALRPGGIMIMSTMCGPTAAGFRPSHRPRAYRTPEEIASELAQAGFKCARSWEIESTHDRSLVPNLMAMFDKA